MNDDLWETHAAWWQEGFTEGADAEYEEQILPLAAENLAGCGRVLDVGTGEGQVARLAWRGGANLVVGVDPTWAQVAEAARRGTGVGAEGGAGGGPPPTDGTASGDQRLSASAGGSALTPKGRAEAGAILHYARAGAARLPFADESFEAVVACLVFEHITDVDAAIAEVARVLVPGGRFLFFLNHPLLQTPGSGWIDDHILEEQYWRIGPYLTEDESIEEVEKDVFIPFIHRPLSRYVNALIANGLLLTRMLEPAPPPGFIARAAEYAEAATIPRLLFLRTEKR